MPPDFSHNQVLTLSPHVKFFRSGEDFVVSSPAADYTFSGYSATIIDRAKFLIDGSLSVGGISDQTGVSFANICKTLEPLLEGAVLRDVTTLLSAKTREEFLEAYFPLCDEWALDIFTQTFWRDMLSGQASPSVVLGWGLEFYHRVTGADEHNALSMNYCRDEAVRRWLIAHFAEEADHGEIFLDGLVSCGFDRQEIIESTPLPSTRALINLLDVLASTDTFSYLACYGVMHSPRVGQNRENIDRQYNALKEYYPFARGLLDKIHEHAAVDIDLGHDGIVFEKLVAQTPAFDAELAIRALGAIKGIVIAFVNFFTGIHEYYRVPKAQLPRGSVTGRFLVSADERLPT